MHDCYWEKEIRSCSCKKGVHRTQWAESSAWQAINVNGFSKGYIIEKNGQNMANSAYVL